jgi:cytochrome c-type biogenesis protein CcmH
VILFWVICVALLAFAVLYVLPPALRTDNAKSKQDDARREANIAIYRDQLSELDTDLRNGIVSQEQYTQDRDDIERRLLEDTASENKKRKPAQISATTRKHAYLVAVGLALVAVIFYLRVGSPDGVTNAAPNGAPRAAANAPAVQPGERTQAQIEANVAALAKRLQSNPSDAQGWTMLARSYSSLEKYGEAAGAFAKATELTPNDADLWADYAYASAMANGRSLEGKPLELVDRALKIDPDNAKALGLAANAAFEAKNYQKAIDYWQRLLKRVPADSDITQTINERINEASRKKAQEAQGGKAPPTP